MTTLHAGEKDFPKLRIGKKAFGQEIADSLRSLQSELGGKNLAERFDGREGKEVAQSTISRWIAKPGRFPAVFLPVLVELDPNFRRAVGEHLFAALIKPSTLMKYLDPTIAEAVARAADRVILEQVGAWSDDA